MLMDQKKEIEERETYLKKKEDEMLTRVTDLVLDMLEIKAGSFRQQTFTEEKKENKKLDGKKKQHLRKRSLHQQNT